MSLNFTGIPGAKKKLNFEGIPSATSAPSVKTELNFTGIPSAQGRLAEPTPFMKLAEEAWRKPIVPEIIKKIELSPIIKSAFETIFKYPSIKVKEERVILPRPTTKLDLLELPPKIERKIKITSPMQTALLNVMEWPQKQLKLGVDKAFDWLEEKQKPVKDSLNTVLMELGKATPVVQTEFHRRLFAGWSPQNINRFFAKLATNVASPSAWVIGGASSGVWQLINRPIKRMLLKKSVEELLRWKKEGGIDISAEETNYFEEIVKGYHVEERPIIDYIRIYARQKARRIYQPIISKGVPPTAEAIGKVPPVVPTKPTLPTVEPPPVVPGLPPVARVVPPEIIKKPLEAGVVPEIGKGKLVYHATYSKNLSNINKKGITEGMVTDTKTDAEEYAQMLKNRTGEETIIIEGYAKPSQIKSMGVVETVAGKRIGERFNIVEPIKTKQQLPGALLKEEVVPEVPAPTIKPYEMTQKEFENIPIIKYIESYPKGKMTVEERNTLGDQLVEQGLMSIEDFNAMTGQFGFGGKVVPVSDIKGKVIPSKPVAGEMGETLQYIGGWQTFHNVPLFAHRKAIIKALVEGKQVPKKVIDEYKNWGWIEADGTTAYPTDKGMKGVTLKQAVESYGVKFNHDLIVEIPEIPAVKPPEAPAMPPEAIKPAEEGVIPEELEQLVKEARKIKEKGGTAKDFEQVVYKKIADELKTESTEKLFQTHQKELKDIKDKSKHSFTDAEKYYKMGVEDSNKELPYKEGYKKIIEITEGIEKPTEIGRDIYTKHFFRQMGFKDYGEYTENALIYYTYGYDIERGKKEGFQLSEWIPKTSEESEEKGLMEQLVKMGLVSEREARNVIRLEPTQEDLFNLFLKFREKTGIKSLANFYTQATKGIKEVKPEIKPEVSKVAGLEVKPLEPAEDYRISHRPTSYGPPAYNLLKGNLMPKDVYDRPDLYGVDLKEKGAQETIKILKQIRNRPDAEITIYRSSPKKELNYGDWVTLSKDYAKQEGLHPADPSKDIPVYSYKVKAKDVKWSMDTLAEWGYFPEKPEAKPEYALPPTQIAKPPAEPPVTPPPAMPPAELPPKIPPQRSELTMDKYFFKLGYKEARAETIQKFNEKGLTTESAKQSVEQYLKRVLSPQDRGKFIGTVRRARTPEDAAKAFARIDTYAEKMQVKTAISKLKNSVDKFSESPSVSVDYRNKIKDLIEQYELSGHRGETIDKLKATQGFIDRKLKIGEDVEIPRKVLDRLKILLRTPKDELTLDIVEGLQKEVDLLTKLGKTKWTAKETLYNSEKELRKNQLLEISSPINSITLPIPQEIGKGIGNWAEKFIMLRNRLQKSRVGLKPMDELAEITGMTPIKTVMDLDFNDYLPYNDKILTEYENLIKNMDDYNFDRIGNKAIALQDGGYQRLANKGITKEMVEAVKLSPEETKVYEFVRKVFDEEGPLVKKYVWDNYNVDVGEVKNYVSFMGDSEVMNELEIYDRFGARVYEALGKTKTVEMGFTKERLAMSAQKLETNIDKIFRRHIDNVAYMLTMGRDIKMYYEIVNSPEMRKKLGDVGTVAWLQFLDLMARKGGSEGAKRIAALDFFRKNSFAGVLAFRLSSALVQFSSFADTTGTIGTKWATKGAVSIGTSRKWRDFIMDNFPEVRKAIGDDISFREFTDNMFPKVARAGIAPLKFLDGLMRSTAAAGAYQKLAFEKGIEIDLTKPDRILVQEATKLMRDSQGSSFFKDQPLTISTGFGLFDNRSLNKTILTFQSFLLNRWSNFKRQVWRLGIKKKDYKHAVSSFIWIAIVGAAMEEGIRRGAKKIINVFRKEKDLPKRKPFWRGAALQTIQSVPIFGQLFTSMTYSTNPIPIMNSFEDAIAGAGKIYKGKHWLTKVRGGVQALGGAGSLLGVPGISQATQIIRQRIPYAPRGKKITKSVSPVNVPPAEILNLDFTGIPDAKSE